jgi:hypothetical protein
MRSVKVNYREEDDIEVDDTMDNRNERSRKKKIHLVSDERRRPVKNWKKVWSDHSTDYDEVDEFYGKNN